MQECRCWEWYECRAAEAEDHAVGDSKSANRISPLRWPVGSTRIHLDMKNQPNLLVIRGGPFSAKSLRVAFQRAKFVSPKNATAELFEQRWDLVLLGVSAETAEIAADILQTFRMKVGTRTPVVAVSNVLGSKLRVRFEVLGVAAYLINPDIEELLAFVSRVIAR